MAKKPVIALEFIQKKIAKNKNLIKAQEDFNDFVLQIIKDENIKDEFKDLKVFTLGSLSYGGLCPYSDIDLLVLGEKKIAEKYSLALEQKISNVKIKWWPKIDVNLVADIFDHISMYFAKALNETDQELIENFKSEQSDIVLKNIDKFRLDLLKDRNSRRSRYGGVGGELSPNLKYGPGGLRDSCQALAWLGWHKRSDQGETRGQLSRSDQGIAGGRLSRSDQGETLQVLSQSVLQGLHEIYQFRFALQFKFQNDQLTLENWPDLFTALSWEDSDRKNLYQALFRQFTFTELIFDSENFNLILDSSKTSFLSKKNKFKSLEDLNSSNAKFLAYDLKKSFKSSINNDENQGEVFDWIHGLLIKPNQPWEIDFIIDSGLIEVLLKNDWNFISGLVQSDHYHKYTVSEHLRQTLKAVCALQVREDIRFSMNTSCNEVSEHDWRVLKWTAVFHDLKKGHPEDHSSLGRRAVEEFNFFDAEEKQVISNLVDHHLRLSTFAFRYEHSDKTQLQSLNDLFEFSQWIRLLLVFTGADIIGSNPMAWNKWKSDQLYFAYKSLMDFRNDKVNLDTEEIEGFELSPYLIKVIGLELLKEDLLLLKQNYEQGELKEDWLVESIDNNIWIRVFKKDFGPGTLSQILNQFYLAGLPVEQAFISSSHGSSEIFKSKLKNIQKTELLTSSDSSYVYNWFRLPSTFLKPKIQIQKRLKVLSHQKIFTEKSLMAKIDKVIYLTENENKLSFVFKGQDQNGVLLYISKIFESLGVNIHKAQINTWGNRIEDLFVVKKEGHLPEDLVLKLNQSLNLPQSIKI
jgi:[protein-PII] uridylyltransferase